MPVLRVVGERWAAGELTVAQEHVATNVLRGRDLVSRHGPGGTGTYPDRVEWARVEGSLCLGWLA